MFLGTSRRWWAAAGLQVALGLALAASGLGGALGTVGGLLLLVAGMAVFAVAPMRYGQGARKRPTRGATPPAAAPPARPRPEIEARDSSEV